MNIPSRIRFAAALSTLVLAWASGCLAAEPAIHGAGASFPFPVYARWATQYRQATGVEIRYEPVGSGAGVAQLEAGRLDFGASDVPLPPAELQRMGLLQFPAVIGAVVPVVNIPGIKSEGLKLSGSVLGDIYLGKIRKWNAPAIAELNPGLTLPSTNITVVHRSDASGTSYLWSEFLSRSNPEWQARVGAGKLLDWPTGVADAGNEGLASTVQRTRMSIGYVEYAYAKQHRLSVASLRNREGQFARPGRAAFEAAAQAARWRTGQDVDQLLIDQPGALSWPIVGSSFILVPAQGQDGRSKAVLRFFGWALRNGQQAAQEFDYVPLPDPALALIEQAWGGQLTPTPAP